MGGPSVEALEGRKGVGEGGSLTGGPLGTQKKTFHQKKGKWDGDGPKFITHNGGGV